ncbi:MAG: DNA polymerase III subunit alpha [Acidobacteriota bacterium]|nr:DNA polymerase III subunit alpha [Acidobacteriota bacterium]
MTQFVHLHLHSQYSLLDGANRINDVMDAAVEANMPAVALTDHGNMFGAIEFYNRAHAKGVKPIIGIEAYTTPHGRHDRTPGKGSSNHLVLLAKNETGYKNLLRLTSASYLEGFYYKPRMDHELLRQHSDGIIALSACLKGEVNEGLRLRGKDAAEDAARELMDIFGQENFYLELQNHGIQEQVEANEFLRGLSRKLGVEMVVSNDCHYLRQSDSKAHDALLCIGTQKNVSDPDRLRYASDQFYMKTAAEMLDLFPGDHRAIENTVAVAERCNLVIPTGTFHLPEFPVPEGYTLDSYFEKVARDGLDFRLGQLRRRNAQVLEKFSVELYMERLEREIGIIKKMGFPGYFLVVWDFMRYSRENGIPVGPGRGSAAGSLVSYALRITDIDPLQYDLLFERFLNPDRISMPDIDIDFCMRRRGEVINYVSDTYGKDRVAQIITFGTLAAKAAIRDVGRVLGLPYAKVDQVAKMVPDMTRSLAQAAKDEPLKTEVRKDPQVAQIVEIGSRLEGLTRHASMHAAGVVITPRPTEELVPLYRVKKNGVETIMTQWDKDVVEDLGLLKMDFLGLRTLTVIDDAVKILQQQGIEIDLERLPLDDDETYQLFCEGRTSGVFQFESSGMKDLLRRARPSKFEDLAAFNALYRPGALSVGMVEEYIQRKLGKKKVVYMLPETQPILEETYGVIVYQEQVMLIAVEVAGFTMAEADVLRKAMGKKKVDVMAKMKAKFVSGAEERGTSGKRAAELWEYIEPFAGYGFNKSHSVAYALLAYQTAYLKAHHPVAFMAAMLNSEMGTTENVAKYIAECREMGIGMLPPDINRSHWDFTVEGGDVRFGLGAIRGIGEGAVNAMLEARRDVGEFRGLAHFAQEVDLKALNHKVFECLIKSGCFDGVEPNRRALWEALDRVLDYALSQQREKEAGQTNLFGAAVDLSPSPDPNLTPWSDRERLSYEKETLGIYLTGNPLTEYMSQLERRRVQEIASVKENGADGSVKLGGLVTRFRRVKIKSGPNEGRLMGRFILEDLTGTLPVAVFANQLSQFGHLLADEAVVVVQGSVRERGSDYEMSVEEIQAIENPRDKILGLELTVPSDLGPVELMQVRDLLIEHPGEVPVHLHLKLPDQTVHIRPRTDLAVAVGPDLVSSLEGLLGSGTVRQQRPEV